MDAPFPLDLEINEIAVTIDERSDAYTVRYKSAPPRVTNPYARDSKISTVNTPLTTSIRAMRRRDQTRSNLQKKTGYK